MEQESLLRSNINPKMSDIIVKHWWETFHSTSSTFTFDKVKVPNNTYTFTEVRQGKATFFV